MSGGFNGQQGGYMDGSFGSRGSPTRIPVNPDGQAGGGGGNYNAWGGAGGGQFNDDWYAGDEGSGYMEGGAVGDGSTPVGHSAPPPPPASVPREPRADGRAAPGTMYDADDPDVEPPLLEELGIDPGAIYRRMLVVLNPAGNADDTLLSQSDMAGAVLVCLGLGFVLLLTGRVQFGYIYGFGLVGCLGMWTVLNLLAPPASPGISLETVISVFGYCLLPITGLAAVGILIDTHSALGAVIATLCVAWSTATATRFYNAVLHAQNMHKRSLIAYPTFLLYGVFALISVF